MGAARDDRIPHEGEPHLVIGWLGATENPLTYITLFEQINRHGRYSFDVE